MIGNSDPDFTDHVIDRVDTDAFRLMPFRSPAAAEVFEYAERQAQIRRRQPREDVISLLLEPLPDGTPLTDLEFKNFFTLLISAGNDTTRYAIASALHVLANQPHLFEQLRHAGEHLWSTAVEELLRWSSPTMHFRRTAVEDVELHGRTIKAGDKVILWFISGDYDQSVFEESVPGEPRTRSESPHGLRPGRAARLSRHVAGAPGVAGGAAGTGGPNPIDPADRTRGPTPVELHQRHQVSAGGGGPIAGPGGAGGRSR